MNEQILKLSEAIKVRRPVLKEVLNNFGHMTLGEYSALFKNSSDVPQKSIQSKADFIQICSDYTQRLVGNETAVKIRKRLTNLNDILTANHHGPTFCNIQIQGEIVYALSERSDDIMPVFAFGDIPLNNVTYPRGIMLSSKEKLPLFSDSRKNSLVSFVEAYTPESVAKALKKADGLLSLGKMSKCEHETVCKILNNIYLDERALACPSYSEQSIIINAKLWNLIFKCQQERYMPDKACFEMEKIVTELLKSDLYNEKSLACNMFFDDSLRGNVLIELDKKFGCWDIKKLEILAACDKDRLLYNSRDGCQKRRDLLAGSGTIFFWGIDSKKRRIPLYLHSIRGKLCLCGIGDSGEKIEIEFTRSAVLTALNDELILPSLFTCFSAVSFARGYECYGGFMQTDYLTKMRNGLADALIKSNFTDWSESVSLIKTENFCTGLQFILQKLNNKMYPAGVIEIISNGGLSKCDIDFIKNTPLEYADYLGMPVQYPHVYRKNERDESLENITAGFIYSELGGDRFKLFE